MHQVVEAFVKLHNLSPDLISGNERKFNGVDHDDERWHYGHGEGFSFDPYWRTPTSVRVIWDNNCFIVKAGEVSKIVLEWVELVEAGLDLEDERVLKGSTLYPWTVSAGLISRKVFDQEQVIERTEDGFNWQYTCKTHKPICWALSDSLVSVLLSAEYDAGFFHGRAEL